MAISLAVNMEVEFFKRWYVVVPWIAYALLSFLPDVDLSVNQSKAVGNFEDVMLFMSRLYTELFVSDESARSS